MKFQVCSKVMFLLILALVLQCSSSDEFYIGITRNYEGVVETFEIRVFTSSADPVSYEIEDATGTILVSTTVAITQPRTHTFTGSNANSFNVPDSSYAHRNKGLHIHTENDDDSISVLIVNQQSSQFFVYGSYIAIPYRQYDVPEYQYFAASTGTISGTSSLILLVGNVDNTTITITPTQRIELPADVQSEDSSMVNVTAGELRTFTLHRLQTITILSSEDLTGSGIVSDKPLTVVSGHECGNVPFNLNFCEHLTVQVPPSVAWGREHLVSPYQGRNGQHYRIIAAENETVVINSCDTGSDTLELSKSGNWVELIITGATYCQISGDKPIAIFQLATGTGTNGGIGDPKIAMIPSTDRYLSRISFLKLDNTQFTISYINIISLRETTVLIDDVAQSVTWNEIQDTEGNSVGYASSLEISVNGNHVVTAFDDFYLLAYGWGSTTGYSYALPGMVLSDSQPVSGGLSIDPFYGSSLGGSSIVATGPAFNEDDVIQCSFDGISVNGTLFIQKNAVVCASPLLTKTGFVDVSIIINGQIYEESTRFYSVPTGEDPQIEIVSDKPYFTLSESVEVEWDSDSLLLPNIGDSADLLVDIALYTVSVESGNVNLIKSTTVAEGIANSGKHTFTLESTNADNAEAVVSIFVSTIITESGLTVRNGKWTDLILVDNDNTAASWEKCRDWAANQELSGQDLSRRLRSAACPPTSSRADLANSGLRLDNAFIERYHPGAQRCYTQRSITSGGLTNQCCYGANGGLITGPPSGGVVNTVSLDGSLVKKIGHLREDLLPREWCCKGDPTRNRCDILYERRGSVVLLNGRNRKRSLSIRQPGGPGNTTPPPTGVTPAPPVFRFTFSFIFVFFFIFSFGFFFGDPHLLTLDLHPYTFNGLGEFVLIETNDNLFSLQGRMVAALTNTSSNAEATVFSAIVAQGRNSPPVQFELVTDDSNVVTLVTLANGSRLDFNVLKSQRFEDVIVTDLGNNTIEASFSDGALVTLGEANGFISQFTVSLPMIYQGITSGLMGNYNGDISDDFMPRNGNVPISINSTTQEIHENFGVTWIISDPSESLFTYSSGEDWSTFYSPNFVPAYEPVFNDQALQTSAEEVCGGNLQCLFDVASTGRLDIGRATQQSGDEIENAMQLSELLSCDPECVNGVCVDNNTCQCAEGFEGELCDMMVFEECSTNPCNNNGTCQNFVGIHICTCTPEYTGLFCDESAPPTPSPSPGPEEESDANVGAIVGGVIGGLVALCIIVAVIVLVILLFYFCIYRKKDDSYKETKDELKKIELKEKDVPA